MTLSTAACLYGAYALYAVFVSPLISPQVARAPDLQIGPQTVENSRPPENRRVAERFLSRHAWTGDAKYQVRTQEAFVYAEEWERVEPGGEIRFKPFALVWKRDGEDDANREPITMVSESALIKFASRFDMTNPRPGRVVGGSLEGKVEIYGPDNLSILGRNFNFSEAALRVWSDNTVAFTHGLNKGNGYGLELDLIPDPTSTSQDKPFVSGVRTVRLLRDVTMELTSAKGQGGSDSLLAISKPADTIDPAAAADTKKRENVTIKSAGSFEFGVESNIAVFQKDVRVDRPTAEGQADSLRCETLTLVFEEAPPKTPDGQPIPPVTSNEPAVAAPPPTPGKLSQNLTFRRLRAEGKLVRLESQRSQMVAEMTELTYDAQNRVVAMHDAQQVRVRQPQHEILCPEITAVHDPKGKIVSSLCRGAGQLSSFRNTPAAPGGRGELAFSAEWLKQLKKYPDDATQLDVIEFEGQALLNQPGQMVLEADIVKIWVTPEKDPANDAAQQPGPVADHSPSSDSLIVQASATVTPQPGRSVQPKRLLALQNVAFASPQLLGQTERLEIWFEDGQLPQFIPGSEPQSPTSQRLPRQSLIPAVGHRTFRPPTGAGPAVPLVSKPPALKSDSTPDPTRATPRSRTQPAAHAGLAYIDNEIPAKPARTQTARTQPVQQAAISKQAEPPATIKPPAKPIHVAADLIRVRAIRDGDATEVAEIWNEGRVYVTQQRDNGIAPLQLQGDRMHVRNYSETHQLMRLIGEPAQIRDREMQLEGADISMDRLKNTVHVEGGGVLRLPVKNSPDGRSLDKPQQLDVWWSEQMQFDGQVAQFFVDVRAVLGDSRMTCQEMQVTLSRRISFSEKNPESSSQETEVSLVVCREGVELDNFEYEENRLMSVRRARGWEFSLHQQSGNTTAKGPGSLLLWRRGNGKRASLAPNAGVQANRPLETDVSEWEYTRIDFAGSMKGNTNNRTTAFHDRVRIVYGPVERSTDIIDPDQLPKDGGWMRCDTLQLTQHAATEGQATYIEMVGTGNTELEGRSFHALADIISYDESKGLYMLRSQGNRKATIWRQVKIGGATSRADAQRMEFNPSRNQLRLDRTSGLDGLE